MAKIDGVVDIETDVKNRKCTFKLKNPDVEYQSQLAQLATETGELKDYSIQ